MNDVTLFKAKLQRELNALQERCTTIQNLLKNLEAYETAGEAGHEVSTTSPPPSPITHKPVTGPTVAERAVNALKEINEPFELIALRRQVEKDGFGKVTRGNWGVVVQKLKKKGHIFFRSGEEGKPGALYERGTLG